MNKSKQLREQFKQSILALCELGDVTALVDQDLNLICNNFDFYLAQNRKAILEEVFTWFEGFLNTDEQRKVLQDKKLSLLEGEK